MYLGESTLTLKLPRQTDKRRTKLEKKQNLMKKSNQQVTAKLNKIKHNQNKPKRQAKTLITPS